MLSKRKELTLNLKKNSNKTILKVEINEFNID